jgi:hypothetical protein
MSGKHAFQENFMPSMARSRWLKLAGIVAIYAAVLAASTGVLVFNLADGKGLPMGAKVPIALAPMIPALFVIPWMIGNFRLMDEMQVRHQLEAIVAAAVAAAFLVMGYSFLEIIGFPRLPMSVVWCAMIGLWLTAIWVQRWRFR